LVAAAGVDGESAQQTRLPVDGQVEVSGDDEDSLACQPAVDADDVVAPADVTGLVHAVNAGPNRPGDGGARSGGWGCCPTLDGSLPTQRLVWSLLVVVQAPAVELVLQLIDTAGRRLETQPRFRRLVRALELAAGLRVSGPRADLLDAQGPQHPLEVCGALLRQTSGEATAVVVHDMRR
jgi:hypothetical protein